MRAQHLEPSLWLHVCDNSACGSKLNGSGLFLCEVNCNMSLSIYFYVCIHIDFIYFANIYIYRVVELTLALFISAWWSCSLCTVQPFSCTPCKTHSWNLLSCEKQASENVGAMNLFQRLWPRSLHVRFLFFFLLLYTILMWEAFRGCRARGAIFTSVQPSLSVDSVSWSLTMWIYPMLNDDDDSSCVKLQKRIYLFQNLLGY